jgi:hypothetical protein
VRGLDLATTVAATDRVTMDLAYSYQSQNVFRGLNGGNGLPYMSNSPNSRGSIGMRYRNDENGLGFELRSRYNEAYPVNSGVYATGSAFPIAPGQAGATTTASGGPGRCSPAPAGTFCYENVSEAVTFDAQITKRFMMGNQKLAWSLNASNLFDNRVRTFPGVPESLEALRAAGARLAVCTNKLTRLSTPILEALDLAAHLHAGAGLELALAIALGLPGGPAQRRAPAAADDDFDLAEAEADAAMATRACAGEAELAALRDAAFLVESEEEPRGAGRSWRAGTGRALRAGRRQPPSRQRRR